MAPGARGSLLGGLCPWWKSNLPADTQEQTGHTGVCYRDGPMKAVSSSWGWWTRADGVPEGQTEGIQQSPSLPSLSIHSVL